ncbi:MAG: hypothetical protein U0797_26135 [Gemmataceae bacterium]
MTLAFTADLPVRFLAVIGAAAAGALLISGCCQVVVKLLFGQRLPPWPLWGVRVLGGVACGWLVALWLFGGGGGGIGGEGGFSLGGGSPATSDKDSSASKKAEKKKDDKDKSDEPAAAPSETLAVEVLGDSPLKKLSKAETFDRGKRYRAAGEPGLRSLEEVKKLILGRREAGPPLKRLEVVLYLDSPDRQGAPVAELVAWANDLEEKGKKWLRVDFSERDRYAPVE